MLTVVEPEAASSKSTWSPGAVAWRYVVGALPDTVFQFCVLLISNSLLLLPSKGEKPRPVILMSPGVWRFLWTSWAIMRGGRARGVKAANPFPPIEPV